MAKNWAICIGINQYDFLTPLRYAREDAQLMQKFLKQEAGFERVLLFVTGASRKTHPSRANLRRAIRQLVAEAKMVAGDNFWFFFSGHGMRHNGQDYLMPSDGDREDIKDTAISINFITDNLRECGADNVVLLLDACRNQDDKGGEGIGQQTAEEARQTGVISIFSCSPNEYSYEIEALKQGAFTHALLDGLGIQGRCATVERLNQYLTHRVPELIRLHRSEKDRQTPYTIAEPITKSHLILLPKYATGADIALLKNDAYQAEVKKQWQLAWQLWIRINAAALGTDMNAIEAFPRIAPRLRDSREDRSEIPDPSSSMTKGNSASQGKSNSEEDGPLPTFSFEVVTVNRKGDIIQRESKQARYFREDCNGVPLDLMTIPGGTFWMGSPEGEGAGFEKPQHKVTVKPFLMGKYPVTQAQWEAVMGNNPSRFKGANRPVEQVSWYDAVEFCEKLSQKTGNMYRLPSEAEWEYACRARTTTPFYFGETLTDKLANYIASNTYAEEPKGEYRQETTPVGSFPPNAFGLYDLHGNVWEWCADHWHENYNGAPNDRTIWLVSNEDAARLLRGGSWNLNPRYCRSANRDRLYPGNRTFYIGFRAVVV